jgi:hypothetical protein
MYCDLSYVRVSYFLYIHVCILFKSEHLISIEFIVQCSRLRDLNSCFLLSNSEFISNGALSCFMYFSLTTHNEFELKDHSLLSLYPLNF